MSAYHKVVLALIALVLTGSVALRAWSGAGSPARPSAPPGALSTGLRADAQSGAADPNAAPAAPWAAALPVVTEGSFFALIGFALGYTTRKLLKLGLILLAVGFVALQVLVHLGAVEVDWGTAIAKLNELVLNVRERDTVGQLLSDRVPAAGGIATGYLLGLRRG
jgi:uncharacterized membrane protein (Fun14 family)